jgi:pSer/pThr/pTyr-binding forkhead associated (FHA) protein
MAKLVLLVPNGTTLDVPLRRERVTIGRRADNDVCLPNLAVSGEHAVVVTILTDSFLEDLGSTNGTLVNGKPIAKHFLRDGDMIDVGRHKLLYFVDDEAIPPSGILKKAMRDAVGDLGEKVEMAKPIVRTRRASPAVVRQDGAKPAEPPKAEESTQRNLAIATSPVPAEHADGDGGDGAMLKFLSGYKAGQAVALTRERTTIGRAGVQLAVIERSGGGYRLRPIEGEPTPVNGRPATPDGIQLAAGDVLEILGNRVEFTAAGRGGGGAAPGGGPSSDERLGESTG